MDVHSVENVSTIPGTRTIVISRLDATIDGCDVGAIKLQYVHLYDPAGLLSVIRQIGFRVVWEYIDGGGEFLVCAIGRDNR